MTLPVVEKSARHGSFEKGSVIEDKVMIGGLFIKICGMTRVEDAEFATSLGVDALGFIGFPGSPRYVSPESARRLIGDIGAGCRKVGVFVDASLDTIRRYVDSGVDTIQLHGTETARFAEDCRGLCEVWRAVRVKDVSSVTDSSGFPCDKYLVDTFSPSAHGGTGVAVDRELAKLAVETLGRPVILAGGLTPDNFRGAVGEVHPFGLDFNTGLETAPGIKDHGLIQKLFNMLDRP